MDHVGQLLKALARKAGKILEVVLHPVCHLVVLKGCYIEGSCSWEKCSAT